MNVSAVRSAAASTTKECARAQQLLREAVVMRVGGIHRHQNRIERMPMDRLDQCVGPVVPRDPQIAHDFLVARLEQRFHGSALGEDLVDIRHRANIVQLPQVNVIGLEQLERSFDHAHRAVARPLFRLGRQKRIAAAVLHHFPDVLLAPALGAAIDRRCVDVIHA
jgi:hypothetical protein